MVSASTVTIGTGVLGRANTASLTQTASAAPGNEIESDEVQAPLFVLYGVSYVAGRRVALSNSSSRSVAGALRGFRHESGMHAVWSQGQEEENLEEYPTRNCFHGEPLAPPE